MTSKATISLAGSTAFHPSSAVGRHAAALDRRQTRLTRDREQGASAEILARREFEVVQATKAFRRSQRRVDRLALLRSQAADVAATKADNAELEARLAAKQEAEDETTKDACRVILDRIQQREADARARRKLSTPEDRHRASRLRKKLKQNPHTERDAAIKLGRRIVTDPKRLGYFVEVQVNKQLDVLTTEHSKGLINDTQFAVGRLLQEAWTANGEGGDTRLEAMIRMGVLVDGDVDDEGLSPRELGFVRETLRLRKLAELNDRIAGVIGWVGVRFLKAILVEGHTFGTYAGCTVGGGDRGIGRVADRFRWLLQSVAEEMHTATGPDRGRIRASREPA